jgi:Tfp pilus assembly protein PilO
VKLQIRQRDRRALILLGAAVLIYGLADRIVLPAFDRLAAAPELAAEKEHQLRRYRRAELRKGQYTDLLKLADERVSKSESVVIPGANLSLVSAELQSLIEATAVNAGLMVSQRMIGTPRRLNDFYAELPITLTFDSTPGQLVSFLNELRAQPRFLQVRTLNVAPANPALEAPKGADVLKNVRGSVTVSALCSADLLKPAGAPK